MPKLYEFNNIQNNIPEKKTNNFNEYLYKFLEEKYLKEDRIPRINIKKIKMLSDIYFQISYDNNFCGWIISDNKNNCVIFNDIKEIETLYNDEKINKILYEISKECFYLIERVSKKKEEKKSQFLYDMNHYTFLGYYLEEKNEVTFYSVVDNYLNLQQFCLPLIEVEDLCYKYQLPYEKSMTMKTDLVTFDQIKREINYIFHRISEDYASYQYFGAIVLIELDRNIISGFKILNQEMKIFHKIKKIKFGKDENDTTSLNENIKKTQTSKLNKFINKLTYFNLPRNKNLYVQLYNNITEEDSLFKCIELIDDLSKNENEIDIILKNSIQNPQQEIINPNLIYTHNLLSCLIPLDTKAQQDNSGNYSISDYQLKNSLKCSTFDNNPDSPEILVNNKITTFKESVIITRKKHHQLKKKKVKFVDDIYNKPIAEIIPIKCFKSHNIRNNFESFSGEVCCKGCKQTSCCVII